MTDEDRAEGLKHTAAFLRDLADRVESGDSLGGVVEWNGFWGDTFTFKARVRTGNLMGQGGFVTLERP